MKHGAEKYVKGQKTGKSLQQYSHQRTFSEQTAVNYAVNNGLFIGTHRNIAEGDVHY